MNHVNMRLLGAKVPYTKGLPVQLIDTLVWNGQFGVQMFFVISGFLILSMPAALSRQLRNKSLPKDEEEIEAESRSVDGWSTFSRGWR